MQPAEFGHFTYKELLTQRKIAQRAMAENLVAKKVHHIFAIINNELDDRRTMEFLYASKHMPKLNFKD